MPTMPTMPTGWRYALLGDNEKSGDQRSITAKARECVASKTFWRIVLAFAIVLLLGNLVFSSPAQDQLRRYGYIKDDATTPQSGSLAETAPAWQSVDWSQYAYCQYVTNEAYLCNSLMIFESLVRVGARAERLMMYPEQWLVDESSNTGRLLVKARDEYHVRLMPIEVQHFDGEITWADSFTKLLAFNQTEYKRVLSLDSDATVLKSMDELFSMPSAPVAMPRAYWLDDDSLSSQLVLIEPSEFEFKRIQDAFEHRGHGDFDMEIVNNLYGKDCAIIPHRRYDLLTGEFRATEHVKYLGNKEEQWDPDRALEEAKFLHFSDWPVPKPWIHSVSNFMDQHAPKCTTREDGSEDCRNKEKWLWFYKDFSERRSQVCGSSYAKVKRDAGVDSAPSRYEPIFT